MLGDAVQYPAGKAVGSAVRSVLRLLVGDVVGYGPCKAVVGLGITLLAGSLALDGAVVGADEKEPSRDRFIGLRVGDAVTPGEVGVAVRLGSSSSPSVLQRDGGGVGSRDLVTPDILPVGVLVGDAVRSRPRVAVGLVVSVSPDSSLASGAHIGAGEAPPPTECPVGPLVGVQVARSESGPTVGPGVCHSPVVSLMDGGGVGPSRITSS